MGGKQTRNRAKRKHLKMAAERKKRTETEKQKHLRGFKPATQGEMLAEIAKR